MFGELLALAILAGDVWAMADISQRAPSPGVKVIWILVILLLPAVGLALWLMLGPRGIRN
jgi:hypothetical protein